MLKHIAEYAKQVSDANEKWWCDPATGKPIERNVGEMLMLVVSELAEALEGERKGLMDDKLPQYKMFDVEIVDAAIRLFDMIGHQVSDPGDLIAREVGIEFAEDLDQFLYGMKRIPIMPSKLSEQLMCATSQIARTYESWKHPHEEELYKYHLVLSLIYIFTIAQLNIPNFQAIYDAKMAFNAVRADHKLENRILPGGKKF